MIRLTRESSDPSGTVLKIEGQLMGEWVALFESECRKLLATEGRATVDLGGVSYLDRQAVRALRTLGRESVVLVNCSPLFEELLTENAP